MSPLILPLLISGLLNYDISAFRNAENNNDIGRRSDSVEGTIYMRNYCVLRGGAALLIGARNILNLVKVVWKTLSGFALMWY